MNHDHDMSWHDHDLHKTKYITEMASAVRLSSNRWRFSTNKRLDNTMVIV